ncbi:Nitrogen assimilation transcription factor nit-4 [Trichuris trichiura]|uniref:Nitrogen assimilation transcription factor nit-4 n=1 Tax=Trichuris trichiura TaxID=36087 RepID=A0A077YYB8_TRITR|nr:Nitrogen assimilation transcription factor nit-4 [Trichuris trichiura]
MKPSSGSGIYDLRLLPMGDQDCLCIPEPPTFTIGPPPYVADFLIHQHDHRQGKPVDTFSCPQVLLDAQNIHSPMKISTGHKLFGWIFVLLMSVIGVKLITMCIVPAISTLIRHQYKRKGVKVSPPGPWGAKRHYLELDGKTNFRGPQDSQARGSDWSYYSIRPISSRQPVKEESTSTECNRKSKLCFWFKRPFQTKSAGRKYDQIQLDPVSGYYAGQPICEAQCRGRMLACNWQTAEQGDYGALSERIYDPLKGSHNPVSAYRIYKDADREYLRSLEPVRRMTPVVPSYRLLEESSAGSSCSPRYSTSSAAVPRTFVSREMWL